MKTLQSLEEQLQEVRNEFEQSQPPSVVRTQVDFIEALRRLGVGERALGEGDSAPDFVLPDQVGAEVRLSDLLKIGNVVLSFFRGAWCPYCETELQALHMALPQIEAHNARLVAVSPQTMDNTMSMAERLLLEYSVLADVGNEVAKQYGVAFEIPTEYREFHDSMAVISEYNGDTSYILPVPATYVIDRQGVIRYAYVNADYTRRAEPTDVIDALSQI